jgi:hypothetical protein
MVSGKPLLEMPILVSTVELQFASSVMLIEVNGRYFRMQSVFGVPSGQLS